MESYLENPFLYLYLIGHSFFFLLSISAFHISHLELNFMQGGLDLISLFYMWNIQFTQHHLLKIRSFIVFDTLLNTDGCVTWIYIWVFHFVPLTYLSVSTMPFLLLLFCKKAWTWYSNSSRSFFLFLITLAVWSLLWFPMKWDECVLME